MIKKISFIIVILIFTTSCSVFKGVEGVNSRNGKVIGGAPSKDIRTNIKRTEKRQKRHYDREMRKRAKRMGTTKKK